MQVRNFSNWLNCLSEALLAAQVAELHGRSTPHSCSLAKQLWHLERRARDRGILIVSALLPKYRVMFSDAEGSQLQIVFSLRTDILVEK